MYEKDKQSSIINIIMSFFNFLLASAFITNCNAQGKTKITSVPVPATSPGAPTNLRVQDNAEQLGVDVANPGFAWYVNDSDRGERQTAYRVLVASSQKQYRCKHRGQVEQRKSYFFKSIRRKI